MQGMCHILLGRVGCTAARLPAPPVPSHWCDDGRERDQWLLDPKLMKRGPELAPSSGTPGHLLSCAGGGSWCTHPLGRVRAKVELRSRGLVREQRREPDIVTKRAPGGGGGSDRGSSNGG